MVDLSSVITVLSAISSISVIAGAVFIVFQLRQNSKLISDRFKRTKQLFLLRFLTRLQMKALQGDANQCTTS
jgi:hypothetical protein